MIYFHLAVAITYVSILGAIYHLSYDSGSKK